MVVTVALHAGNGDIDQPAGLDEGQQLVVQIPLVPPEVVIRIGADHRVKEVFLKGQVGGVRLHGDDLPPVQPHSVEERPVLRRVAPQVGGVDGEPVLLRQEHAGQSLPAAQVAHHGVGRDLMVQQQLLLQLDGVRAHDLGL